METRTFILEIGVEELPAAFVEAALAAMPTIAEELFKKYRLSHGPLRSLATPRRLVLEAKALAVRQEDLDELVVGPPPRIAYAADGVTLSKAGLSFEEKTGSRSAAWEVVATPKGDCVAYRRTGEGLLASEVLRGDWLHEFLRGIPFAKSMRWADVGFSFGRPLQWILLLHGSERIESTLIEDLWRVAPAQLPLGHRFLVPGAVSITDADAYVEALRDAKVMVDVDERRAAMRRQLDAQAAKVDGVWIEDPKLLSECLHLVEWPHVLLGSFDPAFLGVEGAPPVAGDSPVEELARSEAWAPTLPDSVIIAVMRDHQRYFALRHRQTGKLLPHYLNVVNTAEAPDIIIRGNDRVLRARLRDAEFFLREDLRRPLEHYISKLEKVVFHARLGSIAQKQQRLEELVKVIAAPPHRDAAQGAARLCKTDLVTLMVGEFPDLQGEIGEHYYLKDRSGQDTVIANAIRDHYLPRGAADGLPRGPAGAALALADRLDSLVGFFAIGVVPSGSADPFALRRAALGCIRLALQPELQVDQPLLPLLRKAYDLYAGAPTAVPKLLERDEVVESAVDFFRARLRSYFEAQAPADVIEACLATVQWDVDKLDDFHARLRALLRFRERPEYEALAVAFKRAFNLAGGAERDHLQHIEINTALLQDPAELALAERFAAIRGRLDELLAPQDPPVRGAALAERYYQALLRLAELREPLDRFFEQVFVMVEDETLKTQRLALLYKISGAVQRLARFDLLVTVGAAQG